MENRSDILDELRNLSQVLSGMEKTNVFTVPEGYFEALAGDVLASIHEENGLAFNTLPSESLHSVPDGYFDNLAEKILSRVNLEEKDDAGEELRSLSPMLYSIQDARVYDVPAGYFESVSEQILGKLKPQPARIVSMRRRTITIFRYAVAAAFTGVMALGVFKFTAPSGRTEFDPVVADGIRIANENRFEEELAKIPDAEIVKYLENSGSDVNAAIVAASVDANELPTQEDYLNDDKALDKYLNSLDTKEMNN